MIELVDKTNIANVLKYYGYVDKDSYFNNNIRHIHSNFTDYDVDFSDNYAVWEENKKHIFDLFGGKLKVIKELGDQNVCTDSMIRDIKGTFLIENAEKFNVLIRFLLEILRASEIRENKLSRSIEILNVTLKEGWKVTKCFSLLELNKKRLMKQQDLYSTFIQSLNVKGRLVLSIDPLDFITMSVSRSGWSSCHHPIGGYGTGGISYMNDKASMIAYIETIDGMKTTVYDDEADIETVITMPNKIWRQVVTINEDHDYTMQLRQYPNESVIYNKAVTELMTELLTAEEGISYINNSRKIGNDSVKLQLRNQQLYRFLFYCDYHSNNFSRYTTIMRANLTNLDNLSTLISEKKIKRITVGEKIYCACGCGSENWTDHAFREEADSSEYDEDDDDYNYYDD